MTTTSMYSRLQQPLIERTRLGKTLKASLQRPLTLVIAPTGYGKTTLVSQFIEEIDLLTVWQTLEKQDQDIPVLFEHSCNALSKLVTETQGIGSIAGNTPGEMAAALTDYLRTNVATDFIYVIDDIHLLIDSPNAKAWLKSFITTIPPNCHLILIGQAFPPISAIDLIAHGNLISIGQEQLSFNRDEVRSLAYGMESNLTADQLDKIYARMMGWPAGTYLALQPLPVEVETTLFDGERAPEALFDALASQLLQAQSLVLQTFLLNSSTLDRMSPALLQSTLGLTNSLPYLNEARQLNLFITEVQGGLIYHDLFREFLQRKLRAQDAARYIQNHQRAGQWFETQNRLDEAFNHYVSAECWEEAGRIAEETAHIFIAEGKPETILRWEKVLEDMGLSLPRFSYMCATIHRDRYEYELANRNADVAEHEFRSHENTKGLAQVELLRATIDNQRGAFQSAIDRAEPFSTDLSLPSNLRGYALAILGTAELYLPRLEDALGHLKAALPLWRETKDQFAIAQLLMTLQLVYLRLGRFIDAAQCLQEVMAIWHDFGETTSIAMALNNLGYHYHLLDDYDQSLQILQKGLLSVSRIPENRVECHLLWTLGDLQRDRGAFHEARKLYQKSLQKINHNEPFLHASVLISWSVLERWQGHLDQAERLAAEAGSIAEMHHLNWESSLSKVALDAVRIERGEFEFVKSELDVIINDWKQHPSAQFTSVLASSAYGSLLSGDIEGVHNSLKAASANAKHSANLQPLISEIIHTPRLKEFVDSHQHLYKSLQQRVEKLELAQLENLSPEEITRPAPTYSLYLSVLGRENIERDGAKVSTSDWQAVSARELFFYLVFNRPSTRDELGAILWPNSSTQQIRQKFHSTLHRIREALGTNVILFENELYMINPQLDLWCDAFEFKATVKRARLNSSLVAHTEILWRRAVDLYQGDFLADFDTHWALNFRESFTQMYLDALVALADCVRLRGDLQEAISLLKRAVDIDPFREDIHRLLLKDYRILGNRSLIVRHMRHLNRLFLEELGTRPSPETLMLSQSLLI